MANINPQQTLGDPASAPAAANAQQQQPPNGTQPTAVGAEPAAAANAAAPADPPMPESKLPTRKDASLKEFLNKMDDYAPIVCPVPLPILH